MQINETITVGRKNDFQLHCKEHPNYDCENDKQMW